MKIATKDELVSKLKYATALLNASEAREKELRECLGELLAEIDATGAGSPMFVFSKQVYDNAKSLLSKTI